MLLVQLVNRNSVFSAVPQGLIILFPLVAWQSEHLKHSFGSGSAIVLHDSCILSQCWVIHFLCVRQCVSICLLAQCCIYGESCFCSSVSIGDGGQALAGLALTLCGRSWVSSLSREPSPLEEDGRLRTSQSHNPGIYRERTGLPQECFLRLL